MSLKNILITLIEFKTTENCRDNFDGLFNFVDQQLIDLNLKKVVFKNNGYTSILWATEENPKLLLSAHVDILEGEEDMFRPIQNDNKLYGRGTTDMKFAIAVFIDILKSLPNLNQRSVGLLLTSDEELGGTNGTGYLVKNSLITPSLVLLPDGKPNNCIENMEKGVWHLRLTSTGKPAHGSRPYLGVNAIDQLINVYNEIKKSFPNPTSDEDYGISINAGKISGGVATNVVAPDATLDLDIRLPKESDREMIRKAIEEITRDKKITLETLAEGPAFFLDEKNEYLIRYQEAAKSVAGRTLELYQSTGASDARFYALKNIPVIIHSPLGGGAHSEEEWVDMKSLKTYRKIVGKFVEEFNES